MKITDVWSLHYEKFLLQIEGTAEEQISLSEKLKEFFPEKSFFIVLKGGVL